MDKFAESAARYADLAAKYPKDERVADSRLPAAWANYRAGRYADALADGGLSQSVYTVRFVDQDGAPVPGCIVNFCTDETCTPVIADENGVAAFTGAPYAYHLQVIRVPNGYKFDTAQEFYAEENGGEMIFTVTKE